jgi:hypothetical protein
MCLKKSAVNLQIERHRFLRLVSLASRLTSGSRTVLYTRSRIDAQPHIPTTAAAATGLLTATSVTNTVEPDALVNLYTGLSNQSWLQSNFYDDCHRVKWTILPVESTISPISVLPAV